LFQFPPWFNYRTASLDHILTFARILGGCRIAVELRNKSWFEEKHRREVFEFERA
jgi:uncharacterized protein YecE (DUF72 family)